MAEETNAGGALSSGGEEERRKAAALLGAVMTPKKHEALKRNAKLGGRPKGSEVTPETRAKQSEAMREAWARRKAEGAAITAGRPLKALADIPCNCGGSGLDHRSTCPRGRTIRRRQKEGLPLT